MPGVAPNDHVEGFGGIAGDDEVVGRTSAERSEAFGNSFFAFELDGAHIVGAFIIYFADVTDKGFKDLFGLDTIIAVLEVDIVGLRGVLESTVGDSEGEPKQDTESTINVASVRVLDVFP